MEFHRRLKVYHAWKTRNKKQGGGGAGGSGSDDPQRAPQSVVDAGACACARHRCHVIMSYWLKTVQVHCYKNVYAKVL